MDRKRDMRVCEPEMAVMMKKGNIDGAERAALGGASHGIDRAERHVYKDGGRVHKDIGGGIKKIAGDIGSGVTNAANSVGDWFKNTFHFDEGGEAKAPRCKKAMGGVGKVRKGQYNEKSME